MKSWKKFLLAVFFSMAVVSTAYAEEPKKIWQKAVFENDANAEAILLKALVDIKVVSGANVSSDALANAVFDKAVTQKCFNQIPELNSESFLDAFRAEWKVWFLKYHQITTSSLTWEAFKKMGYDNKGITSCDQDDNARLVEIVNNKQKAERLQNQAQQLASKPMTPADEAKLIAFEAMIKDLEFKIKTGLDTNGAQDKAIADLRTDVDKANTAVVAIAAEVKTLTDGLAEVKISTDANTQAVAGFNGLPAKVEELEKQALVTDATLNPPGELSLPEQIAAAVQSIGLLNVLIIVAIIVAALTLGLVIRLFLLRHNDEKETMPLTAKVPAGTPPPVA